jgi:hypothetical protein
VKSSWHLFAPQIAPVKIGEPMAPIIDLKELSQTAKDPSCAFLRHRAGIFLKEEREHPDEERFVLSHLESYRLRWEALSGHLEWLFKRERWRARMVPNPLYSILQEKIALESQQLRESLSQQEVGVDELMHVHFSLGCRAPQQLEDGTLLLPPLYLQSGEGSVQLVGQLRHISPQGMVVYGKAEKSRTIATWPLFLAFCLAVEKGMLAAQRYLIFAKEPLKKAKNFSAFFTSAQEPLMRFIRYHQLCVKVHSPLHPKWVGKSQEQLKKQIQTDLKNSAFDYVSPYLRWIWHSQVDLAVHSMQEWATESNELYGPLLKAWFKEDRS